MTITADEVASISYNASNYCQSDTDPTPSITGVTGGIFSSTSGLIINSSTGAINLGASTPGSYTVSYLSSSNLCATTATTSVSITADEDGSFTYASSEYCKSGSNPTPTITGTTGGSFSSGTGLVINTTTGQIDVASSTAGIYTVSYLTSSNQCAVTGTFSVTITADEVASVSYGSSSYCKSGSDPDPSISGVTGGTFSSTSGLYINSSTGVIDLSASSAGNYTVSYLTSSNLCAVTVTTTVTIIEDENASFAYTSSSYCSDDTDPTPYISGTTGGTFSASSGVVINSSNGTIDLDASTSGTHTITYTTPGSSCSASSTWSITISDPSADFNYSGTVFCTGGSDPYATITGTTGGTFTSTPSGLSINANTGTIDVSASTAATYDVTYTPPAILQLGSDVDGVANADHFGWSVSMSNDGNRMVIGANLDDTPGFTAGSVEVYEYSSGSWTKMGSTINGEAAYDQFGYAVSMNGAGTRIVVGAITNDGNGSNSGHVRVFDWNGTAWIQLGADVNGESDTDYFGNSVSINDAGDRIVVGAYLNDGNGSNSGHARVFDWNGIVWTQVCLLYTSPSPRDTLLSRMPSSA